MDNIIACDGLGGFMALNHPTSRDACCRLSDQNSTACQALFSPTGGLLDRACLGGPEICRLYDRCRRPETLYVSAEQNDEKGDGSLLLARYRACANIPTLARLSSEELLAPYIQQSVQKHLRLAPVESEVELSLQQITSSVTDCLSSTCRSARENEDCYDNVCAPVHIISNSTSPNLVGINDCLWNICNAGTGALPWADADIVGIGVFSSYVMQCALSVILWVGLALFTLHRHHKPNHPVSSKNTHFASWIDLLLEFHKAQCYFSGTLMIAVIVSNIFSIDLVIAFLIIPLATNSILPIVFSYFLLVSYRASSSAIAILTTVVYILSSIVYWILYSHLPLSLGMTRGDMYKRFRLKASSISACGEYSGLAVCPAVNPGSPEFQEGIEARRYLRVLTPLIWGWATVVLLAMLAYSAYARVRGKRWRVENLEKMVSRPGLLDVVFWATSVIFLAGVGMQISVLSTAIKLGMVDAMGWSFGQVVAVTIWIPPVLEYACGELKWFFSTEFQTEGREKDDRAEAEQYCPVADTEQ